MNSFASALETDHENERIHSFAENRDGSGKEYSAFTGSAWGLSEDGINTLYAQWLQMPNNYLLYDLGRIGSIDAGNEYHIDEINNPSTDIKLLELSDISLYPYYQDTKVLAWRVRGSSNWDLRGNIYSEGKVISLAELDATYLDLSPQTAVNIIYPLNKITSMQLSYCQ